MGVRASKRRCSVCHAAYTGDEAFCPRDGGPIVAELVADDPLVGKTIDGRYLVIEPLGRGGMGKVYVAEHVGLGKRVAIKLISDDDADRETRSRFRREARAASKIAHENVVQIFDVGVDADRDYIVMEYLEGRDLDDLLREGALSPARAIGITRQLLRGLHAVHQAGVVHRDIKPSNVRLLAHPGSSDDVVKLMDFGIARPVRTEVARTDTGTGQIIGTPQFMAPEQLTDGAVDHRADLYAVGATLYTMLAGRYPFATTSVTQRIAAPTPPPLDELRPGLPPSLIAALERALAHDPRDRFADALAFSDALAEAAELAAARMDAPTARISQRGLGDRPISSAASTRESARQLARDVRDSDGARRDSDSDVRDSDGKRRDSDGERRDSDRDRTTTERAHDQSPIRGGRSLLPVVIVLSLLLAITVSVVVYLLVRVPTQSPLAAAPPDGGPRKDDADQVARAPTDGVTSTGDTPGSTTASTSSTISGSGGSGATGSGLTGSGLAGSGLTGSRATGSGLAGSGATNSPATGAGSAAAGGRAPTIPPGTARKATQPTTTDPPPATTGNVATTFTPLGHGIPDPVPICDCLFQNERAGIANACVRKRSDVRCSCYSTGRTLCPVVLTVIDGGKRKPDGAKTGTMNCVDRTRAECDPSDRKMPDSCRLSTRTQVNGFPADNTDCAGYIPGLVEGDPLPHGTWSCSSCDWALVAPKFTGKSGDRCNGFDGRTGAPVTGVLRCPKN